MTTASKTGAVCGAWPAAISAAMVAAGAIPLSAASLDGADLLWLEGRAQEGGRTTLLRRRAGHTEELTPAPFNVRSRVHEYGGGAYVAQGGRVWFSHGADNRLYLIEPGAAPRPVSAPDSARRFADLVRDAQRSRLIAICEDHGAPGPCQNRIVAIGDDGRETTLVEGHDFFSSARLSPDGRQLAWLSWDHPRMPWEGSELWLAEVKPDGSLGAPRLVAGAGQESICQPEWSPAGVLHFVSDRSGWWNLYRLHGGQCEPVCPRTAEFATPHWTFGNSMYGFRANGEIVCTYIEKGVSRLAALRDGQLRALANPYQEIRELRVHGDQAVLLAGAPTIAAELATLDLAAAAPAAQVLVRSISALPDLADLSVPEPLSYPSVNGRIAHAFYYPPANARYCAAPGSKPPLIVIGHGGPTGMATSTLKLATQYWTNRGFAVLDVNYGGSTGFGRAYRDLLRGQWGVVDVEDCVAGARYLATRGLADPERLIIRGSSAGGLTTLCALTFHDVFKAGASYYGVSDLQGLDDDSHKFESHYNAYLIAPPPEAAGLYRLRSPIHHTELLARPMIFFQGLDDKVVPPQQSEAMAAALRARGLPVAYVALEGEGHGFRKAESIVRTLEAELYFYQRVLALPLPPGAPPVAIDNLA
ncbi:prolyl oligopeptidase family serine peptidase [Massilia sp. TS11]|uniref:S9 family peptidase n=1 Tax=Massilia sp. TS11 TaxID=2908003 RepID=UPI001EDBED22|nr:prolyl oligopeptidase family serine peptidase [Massilia sp. TS11]MCG2585095.1 prolyl oligopeptidase family serine peptidase [Massilia sp. TS11]